MLCYYLGCAKCVPVSMAGLCGQGESELQLSGGHSLWTCAARDLQITRPHCPGHQTCLGRGCTVPCQFTAHM